MLITNSSSSRQLHNYLVAFRPGEQAVLLTGLPELPRRLRELAALVLEDVSASQVCKDRSFGLQDPKPVTVEEALEIANRPFTVHLQSSLSQNLSSLAKRVRNPITREGFWKSSEEPDLPMPVARDDPHPSKDRLLKALLEVESGAKCVAYRGFSRCRICNRINGGEEYTALGFTWPSGLSHYIKEHNVRVSMQFGRLC